MRKNIKLGVKILTSILPLLLLLYKTNYNLRALVSSCMKQSLQSLEFCKSHSRKYMVLQKSQYDIRVKSVSRASKDGKIKSNWILYAIVWWRMWLPLLSPLSPELSSQFPPYNGSFSSAYTECHNTVYLWKNKIPIKQPIKDST